MSIESSNLPTWLRGEKRRHHALVALAILASAGIASAATNERRMFAFPGQSFALTSGAIAAPEPTSLRSAIMGYLDGCAPDIGGRTAGFDRAIERNDCGLGRKRMRGAPAVDVPAGLLPAANDAAALLASPDADQPAASPDELAFVDADLLVVPDLPIERATTPSVGDDAGVPPPTGNASTIPLAGDGTTPDVPDTVDQGAIPEPATWALMMGGFGLVGGVLRRREKRLIARA